LMTRLVMTSGRVGLTRMWIFLAAAGPLSVSPMIQRTVSPTATGPELLTGLQGYVGHLTGRGVDLIERTGRERIDLHGIDETVES
jgi:hypothetical protein